MVLVIPLLVLAAYTTGTPAGTMNPFPYKIANNPNTTDHGPAPPFTGEHFDIIGKPITYQYSQVHWSGQQVPLPREIVARFDNKVMVVTGYEVDVVRKSPSNASEYVSVPATQAYNHHYTNYLHGKSATMIDQSGNPDAVDDPHAIGKKLPGWKFAPGASEFPHAQVLSEGNGNEHRGSYKAYSSGFGLLIESPTTLVEAPMMINTNKMLTSDAHTPGPIGGPLPRSSLAPPNASYSGILECPCTTRIEKVLDGYKPELNGRCDAVNNVASATECLHAVNNLGVTVKTVTNVSIAALPSGCSVTFNSETQGWTATYNGHLKATGRCDAMSPSTAHVSGTASSLVQFELDIDAASSIVTIDMSGPSTVWFGVGFNATSMSDQPYTIVVDGTGQVQERQLANHQAGSVLSPSVTIVNSTVQNGIRRVVMRRPLTGATPQHLTFNASTLSIDYIDAIGSTSAFSIHKNRTTGRMLLAPFQKPLCVCRDPSNDGGTIDGLRWHNPCAPMPVGQLIEKHNAICSARLYNGGLYCCHNGVFLLDADQQIPPKPETIFFRYRFYFKEYTPGHNFNLYRVWWSTEAYNNEYDVPQSTADCTSPATPPEQCVYSIRSNFTGRDLVTTPSSCMNTPPCFNATQVAEEGGSFVLLHAAMHCHAPACQYAELWDMDANKLICRNNATYGHGSAPMDEESYVVAIPPCVWGTSSTGLAAPPVLTLDGNYSTIKHVNNTVGHYGVMGLWQMRAGYISDWNSTLTV